MSQSNVMIHIMRITREGIVVVKESVKINGKRYKVKECSPERNQYGMPIISLPKATQYATR